jgi:hypothetical protein
MLRQNMGIECYIRFSYFERALLLTLAASGSVRTRLLHAASHG